MAISCATLAQAEPVEGQSGTDYQASISAIETARMSEAETAYADYLLAIDAASSDLVAMTVISEDVLTGGDSPETLGTMKDAVSASALLADLPYPDEAEAAAIARGLEYSEVMEEICGELDPAPTECEAVRVKGVYIKSRQLLSDLLGVSMEDGLDLTTVKAKLSDIEESLPSIIDVLQDENTADVMQESAAERACTLQRAVPIISNSIGEDNIAAFETSYRDLYIELFDLSGLPLCDGDEYSCRAAERCARAMNAGDCIAFKVERMEAWCPADTETLEETLVSLK